MNLNDVEIGGSTQDKALLVQVIKASSESGHTIGRTALQKIAYFLKRLGVPMKYGFELYNYGPFCQDILWDTDELVFLRVINDDSVNRETSHYKPGSSCDEFLSVHKLFLGEHEKTIRKVAEFFAPLDTKTLEIVSTLDYCFNYVKAAKPTGPYKEEVLKRFFIAKEKYNHKKGTINKMYDNMEKLGMVEK